MMTDHKKQQFNINTEKDSWGVKGRNTCRNLKRALLKIKYQSKFKCCAGPPEIVFNVVADS